MKGRLLMNRRIRVVDPKYLVNVSPSERPLINDQPIRSKHDIKKNVELPMVKAVEYLFDLGIQTSSSGACALEVKNGYAFLEFKYDSLSDENKQIARKLGIVRSSQTGNYVFIQIDVNRDSTVEYIENVTHVYVSHFKPQRADWAIVDPSRIEEYMERHGESLLAVLELFHYYRDPQGKYWLSEELYKINRPRIKIIK